MTETATFEVPGTEDAVRKPAPQPARKPAERPSKPPARTPGKAPKPHPAPPLARPAPKKRKPKPKKRSPARKKPVPTDDTLVAAQALDAILNHPGSIPPLLKDGLDARRKASVRRLAAVKSEPKPDRLAAARAALARKRALQAKPPLGTGMRAALTKATAQSRAEPYKPNGNGNGHDPQFMPTGLKTESGGGGSAPKRRWHEGRGGRPVKDPTRTALAAVNERIRQADEVIRRQSNGLISLQQRKRVAEEKVERCKKAIVTAREAYQSALADAAASDKPEPTSGVPAAEAVLAEAQAHLEGLKGACRLNEEGNGAVRDRTIATREQDDLIKQIIIDEVRDPLLPVVERAWKTFMPLIQMLDGFKLCGMYDGDLVHQQIETRRTVNDFLERIPNRPVLHPNPCNQFAESLRQDAHAPLPSIIANALRGAPEED